MHPFLRCVLLAACSAMGTVARADDALLKLEIRHPMRLAEHQLAAEVWSHLSQSRQVQNRLASPEFDRVHQAIRFLEAATGVPWQTALEQLTAAGVVLTVESAQPPVADLVATAADAELLGRVHEFVREELRERVPAGRLDRILAESEHHGTKCYRLGDAHYALAGSRLIVASTAERLRERLDDLAAAAESFPGADGSKHAVLRARWNLERLREFPEFARNLALPSDDPGRTALLGGWFDLLRAGQALEATISLEAGSLAVAIRTDAAADDLEPGLRGFFATGEDRAAPLLDVPGAVYSASWYRDWGALWEARGELLQTDAREKLEKGNEDVRKQFSAFKIDFNPSELMSSLGPHFRVVLARQDSPIYDIELNERLPAGLLVIDLENEETFRAQATPLMRVVGLLTAFGRPGLLTRRADYRDAELTGLYYADDPNSAASGNRIRFNFNPTWTITRGHFLVGSTGEIVRNGIDALDRRARVGEDEPASTEVQVVDLSAAGSALADFDEGIIRGSVFGNGWTVEEAESELAVLRRILETVGRVETRAGFSDGRFVYRVRIGTAE